MTLVTAAATAVGTLAYAQSATAEPAPTELHLRTDVTDGWVVTTIDAGMFAVAADGRSISVVDDAGRSVAELPLAFALGDRKYNIQQAVSSDGRSLRLAPDLASAQPLAQPVASPLENQLATTEGVTKLGMALAVGPLAGAIAGAIVGVVVALASCAVLAVGCLLTGLPIIAVFAGAGGLVGTVVGGGAGAAYAAWNYLNTLNAAPGQSPYAKDDFGTNGAGVPDPVLRVPKLPTGSAGGSSSGSAKG
ncbi:ammonium transporter [Nocardia sp. NPDC101769]|uniref:ammonium transporter n=1 Tax=Nocardia sp. NPDC101769 TaxID=3364333 RepID=UPI00380B8D86